jgi:hypothetical protein
MRKRWKTPMRKSKRLFSKTANRTHKFNLGSRNPLLMRGGTRM